ncbi:MAG: PVC-type heme-binding CxxCH protein, partial [Chthoniobacteraceae bacterium]
WLRDTDGDLKADKVEKLYTGLGTQDTHAVINNPRWGWDGWIYATHGYSASQNVKNAKGESMPTIGSGVVRFKPDGSAIEQYSSKGGNTWGLEITGDNRVMWTQPTSGQLLMQTVLPEYALARGKIGDTTSFHVVEPSPKSFPLIAYEQLPYVQIDWVGSFTAAAGCVIYDGGSWPAEYNGDYFCTEPTINVIHHTRLVPDGSSYKAAKLPGREETEFVRSKDMWWRPIEVHLGPDGAMYVSDFYNQAVIHNDTRGPDHNNVNAAVRPDRDHYFGRIWRLDHKDAKKLEVPDLSKADINGLLAALENPNGHVRMMAARLIEEKHAKEFAGGWDAKWKPETKMAMLWVMQRLGMATPQTLGLAMADENAGVRRNAALVAEANGPLPDNPQDQDGVDAVNKLVRNDVIKLLNDPDAHVRLAALRALGARHVTDEVAAAVVKAWPKLDDNYQRSAAVGTAAQNPTAAIAAALDSQDAAGVAPLVAEVSPDITFANDAAKLVLILAAKPASVDPIKRAVLDALVRNLKDPPPLTPEISTALTSLLASGASASALPLAAQWDKAGTLKSEITKLIGRLALTLNDPKAADDARISAAQSLIGLSSEVDGVLATLTKQLNAAGSADFKRALVGLLAETNETKIGTALSEAYSQLPPDVRPTAFDAVLKRADWANAFLDAVQSKKVDPASLGTAATFRLRSYPNQVVAKRATEMLDQLNPTAAAKKEAIAKLSPIVEQPGNPETGKALFNATCAICHKFIDAGADIGPGLTGMGSHGAGELLGAIVDPNAEVDPSFVTWNIEAKDGQIFSGVITAENPSSITLKSLAGVQEIKTADIKSRVNTGRSLMPEGFDGLGGEPLRDIIAYMQ